jgi:hypothetical protein
MSSIAVLNPPGSANLSARLYRDFVACLGTHVPLDLAYHPSSSPEAKATQPMFRLRCKLDPREEGSSTTLRQPKKR